MPAEHGRETERTDGAGSESSLSQPSAVALSFPVSATVRAGASRYPPGAARRALHDPFMMTDKPLGMAPVVMAEGDAVRRPQETRGRKNALARAGMTVSGQ